MTIHKKRLRLARSVGHVLSAGLLALALAGLSSGCATPRNTTRFPSNLELVVEAMDDQDFERAEELLDNMMDEDE